MSPANHAHADSNEELVESIKRGDVENVRNLIAFGADVNAKDEYGNTALILAVFHRHADIVQLLLAAGA